MAPKIHSMATIAAELKSELPAISGSVALIYCVDHMLIPETFAHYQSMRFHKIVFFIQEKSQVFDSEEALFVELNLDDPDDFFYTIATTFRNLGEHWIYWGYNAEFLMFPFCESRTINDFTTFIFEEKRLTCFGMVADAYPSNYPKDAYDLTLDHIAVDTLNYHFCLLSTDRFTKFEIEDKERLVEVRGGLRWRFSEHISKNRNSLSRISLYRNRPDLEIDESGFVDNIEFYSFRSKHHRSPTSAIISLRFYLDLIHNPPSRSAIPFINWEGSEELNWASPQLLRLGFIETGQWF